MQDEDKPFVISYSPNPRFEIKSAESFGKIQFIFNDVIQPPPALVEWDKTVKDIQDKLIDIGFNPAMDFIVITGNAARIAMLVSAVVGNSNGAELSFLVWNEKDRKYVPKVA